MDNRILSVVLPCYNPAANWIVALKKNIQQLDLALPEYQIEYIISNDGSTRIDKSGIIELQQQHWVVFLDHSINQGKGAAIRKGVEMASGEYIIYSDIDFPFGVISVVEMVKLFESESKCDFIYGKRGEGYFAKLPLARKLISKFIHYFNYILFNGEIIETQAGIKGLRNQVKYVLLATKTNTFVFEIELMVQLYHKRYSIHSLDVYPISSIEFSNFSLRILAIETLNLYKIIFNRATKNLLY